MEEKTRKRLTIHVTTITTEKQKETETFSAARLKETKTNDFHSDWIQKILTFRAFRLKTENTDYSLRQIFGISFCDFSSATTRKETDKLNT